MRARSTSSPVELAARGQRSMADAGSDLARWDRTSMWGQGCFETNPRLRSRTREFADRWYELTADAGGWGPIGDSTEMPSRLIREREHALKGARARLTYAEARDRREGFSDVRTRLELPLDSGSAQITTDIISALEQG